MSSIFSERLFFPQENGKEVELLVNGDEFYARYENLDGYTVVYDSEMGEFCYAEKVHGYLISSRIRITKKPPKRIKRRLKEAPEIRAKKFNARFRLVQPGESPVMPFPTIRTFGPNNGLLNGRQVSSGMVRGLVILVEFSDVKCDVTKEQVEAVLNDEGYNLHGNQCSVRDYFLKISDGNLDYSNVVVGPVSLPKHRQYYVNHPLFSDVLDEIVSQGIDLSAFDSRNEKVIDAISFMYAGRTLYQDWLWPHNHVLDWRADGYRSNFYQITSLGLDASGLSIGTFCHESGHMLCRFPDLYDYGKRDGDFERSSGLGGFCLMSSGNHLNGGRSPAPVSAYLRDLAGWCKRIRINSPKQYECTQGDYSSIHIYETDSINEYFLLENKSRRELDVHLPSSGLAIYHCDTLGSNEYQGGTPDRHYQCGLLQADGNCDLERNRNRGDELDLFKDCEGTAVSHDTTPHSCLWDGCESGLVLKDISTDGELMTFEVVEE